MSSKRASWRSRILVCFMAGSFLFSSCASTTRINTEPEGAKVKINGIFIGETPNCVYRYRAGLPDTYLIEIEKPGYKRVANATIERSLRADASLFLLILAIVPYFFSARLEDQYLFHLEPEPAPEAPGTGSSES